MYSCASLGLGLRDATLEDMRRKTLNRDLTVDDVTELDVQSYMEDHQDDESFKNVCDIWYAFLRYGAYVVRRVN